MTGHVASEVFDHSSQLKLVSERFGVGVPNVSAWRRQDRRRSKQGGASTPASRY